MENDTQAFIESSRVALEQREVAATNAVSRQAVLHVSADHFADALMMRLESYVLAEKLMGDTKTVEGYKSSRRRRGSSSSSATPGPGGCAGSSNGARCAWIVTPTRTT